jgi:hypothetical protein
MTVARDQDFYGAVRDNARALWNALNELQSLQAEWNAGDYGSALAAGAGSNDGLVAQDLGGVVFAGADALRTVMNTGVATNFVKVL